ncbi:MAG: TIGR00725 family protein [Candidatus Thermoplasmatota archaeon]
MKNLISVCGSDSGDKNLSEKTLKTAEKVGCLIAERNAVLVCGGHGGIMKAACKGCKKTQGLTVGIMPYNKKEANPYIDIAIPTDLGNIRNYLVANTGDVTIALGGRWGTLNEISYRMITGKPLILIKNTGGTVDKVIKENFIEKNNPQVYIVDSAEEAVDKAFEIIKKNR